MNRARLLVTLLLLGYLALFVRIFYWQVLAADELKAVAERQHFDILEIVGQRGEILADDEGVMAANRPSFLLWSDKRYVDKKRLPEIITELEKIIKSDQNPVATKSALRVRPLLEDDNLIWVSLAKNLSPETKLGIEGFRLKGFGFEEEASRYYPEASMSAHVMGIVGQDDRGLPKGYFGLEGYYDRDLAGKPGQKRLEKDAFGRPIPIGNETTISPINGSSLVTTINKNIQRIIEKELADGVKNWQAKSGTVIVMRPKTGEILGMASFPKYDPQTYSLYSSELFKNPAVAGVYEPGSIMKPLVMAAAINEAKVAAATRCDVCAGPRAIGGGVVKTFNEQYHPNLTMTEVLENSDNTGMVFIGEKLGKDLLFNYLFDRYKFGVKTGVDLQEEEAGTVKRPDQWYALDLATVTFGQGIGVTPIQMASNFCVLANGGYQVRPHFVKTILDSNRRLEIKPPPGRQILKGSTTAALTQMLISVTEKSPLHFPRDREPILKKYKIAAKSGTAQIALGGEYKTGVIVGSVIGYFPAEDPQFVVMVKLDEPAVRQWGSDTAGPVFFAIAKQLLLYYGIAP